MIMQTKVFNNIDFERKSMLKNRLSTTSLIDKVKYRTQDIKKSKPFNSFLSSEDFDSEEEDDDDDVATPWICWPCSRVFQFKCLLFKHQLHCNASYRRKQTVGKQLRKNLVKKILPRKRKAESTTCPVCHETFNSRPQYKLHRLQGLCSKKRVACINCRKKFKSFHEFRVHDCNEDELTLQNHSPKCDPLKTFICKCCESKFDEPELFKTHLLQSKTCTKIHHLRVKMEYQNQQYKGNLTARKSFPKALNKTHLNNNKNNYLHSFNAKINELNSPSPTRLIGSARKSFPNSPHKTPENHVCHTCSINFSSLSKLKLHEKHHIQNRNKQLSRCFECQETFSSSYELVQHQADFDHYNYSPKTFTPTSPCPFCNKKFLHIQNRNAHLRYHTEKTSSEIKEFVRKTTCGVCFRTFSSENLKEEHIRMAHIKMTISSPLAKSYVSSSNSPFFSQNSSNEDSSPSYNPPKLVVLTKVTETILKQLRNVPNVCPVCCRTYDSNAIRNRHFRLHVMGSSCECELCSRKFPLTTYLETHMKNDHKNMIKYECKNCDIILFSRIAILQHVMKNHPQHSMTDLIQEKSTIWNNTNRKNYSSKMESNETKEEFHCNICNLKFMKLCGLRRHQSSKLHSKVLAMHIAKQEKVRNLQFQLPPRAITPPIVDYSKSITCTECTKEFSTVQSFVPHRLSHFSGENEIILTDEECPYTCEVCGKLLDSQQKIQVHLIWHLQDVQLQTSNKTLKARKSFPSSKSSVLPSFTSTPKESVGQAVAKKSFKVHKKQEPITDNVKNQPFICKNCNANFTEKRYYLLHMKQYCHATVQEASENSNASDSFAINCGKCNKFFDEKTVYDKHQKFCDLESAKAYCANCGCLFSTTSFYDDHKTSFCTSNFKAHINENFINKNLDVLINSIKSDMTIISCIQCCLMFSSVQMLSDHMEKHKITVTVNGSVSESVEMSNDSDSDYASRDYKEDKLDSWQNEKSVSNETDNEDSQLCRISNINTIDPNLFAMENSENSLNLSSDEDKNVFTDTVNCHENNLNEITELRQNFSRLLSALVSDVDLMNSLGFGERLIDDVLVSVLEKMALKPVDNSDDSLSELDKLRCNIRTLLDVCIKDQIMEFITDSEITTDKIVIAALKMFGVESE